MCVPAANDPSTSLCCSRSSVNRFTCPNQQSIYMVIAYNHLVLDYFLVFYLTFWSISGVESKSKFELMHAKSEFISPFKIHVPILVDVRSLLDSRMAQAPNSARQNNSPRAQRDSRARNLSAVQASTFAARSRLSPPVPPATRPPLVFGITAW